MSVLLRNNHGQVYRTSVAKNLYLWYLGSVIAVDEASQGCFVRLFLTYRFPALDVATLKAA